MILTRVCEETLARCFCGPRAVLKITVSGSMAHNTSDDSFQSSRCLRGVNGEWDMPCPVPERRGRYQGVFDVFSLFLVGAEGERKSLEP
jgi:hypothetical protein